jgi:Ohr subfamily peroxiredoxin
MSERRVIYTAQASVIGGRDEGQVVTEDGGLALDIRVPAALGGPGGGTNPEQLLAAGWAACFSNAVKLVARRMKIEGDDADVNCRVSLAAGADRYFDIVGELDVTLPSYSGEQAHEIVRKAHTACPFSRAMRGNADPVITVNGEPLADE